MKNYKKIALTALLFSVIHSPVQAELTTWQTRVTTPQGLLNTASYITTALVLYNLILSEAGTINQYNIEDCEDNPRYNLNGKRGCHEKCDLMERHVKTKLPAEQSNTIEALNQYIHQAHKNHQSKTTFGLFRSIDLPKIYTTSALLNIGFNIISSSLIDYKGSFIWPTNMTITKNSSIYSGLAIASGLINLIASKKANEFSANVMTEGERLFVERQEHNAAIVVPVAPDNVAGAVLPEDGDMQ